MARSLSKHNVWTDLVFNIANNGKIVKLETPKTNRGKFGEVKRCVEKASGKEFAAKFIVAPRPQDKSEVEQEVQIMKKLQHKRLLQLYDCFCSKTEMCLVLEIILGGELFDRVIDDDFILTERACVVFMRQICEGVDYMHSRRIIHLDMKPENILCLTRTGNRIKIIDFGLAREVNPKKDLRVLFGTPEFMAPEVVQYEPISFATDMWSVGVICYVLLSGLSPFMGDNDGDTLVNVIKGEYDFNYAEFSDVTDPAKDLIRQLLVKDKTKRLSATECLQHAWLRREERKRSAQLDLSKKSLRRFVYRRKWQKVVTAIIALRRMGVRLMYLRNRRSLSGRIKSAGIKNGMRTPEMVVEQEEVTSERTEPMICDVTEQATDMLDVQVEENDDSSNGVSVTATIVIGEDSGDVIADKPAAEQSNVDSGYETAKGEETDIRISSSNDATVTVNVSKIGSQTDDEKKPTVLDVLSVGEDDKEKINISGRRSPAGVGSRKDSREEESTGDDSKDIGKRKIREKSKTREKDQDQDKYKQKDKDKSPSGPWCSRRGRPEPGILRHVPISERHNHKPAPKRTEAPWSKRRIRKQDGIHLQTLKDWREVKDGNSKVPRNIPADSTTSTIETSATESATESPDREQLCESRLMVDSGGGGGVRSRKNSEDRKSSDRVLRKYCDSRKKSDTDTGPEAPANMRVRKKSKPIEIENGRPKSQNLDNIDESKIVWAGKGDNNETKESKIRLAEKRNEDHMPIIKIDEPEEMAISQAQSDIRVNDIVETRKKLRSDKDITTHKAPDPPSSSKVEVSLTGDKAASKEEGKSDEESDMDGLKSMPQKNAMKSKYHNTPDKTTVDSITHKQTMPNKTAGKSPNNDEATSEHKPGKGMTKSKSEKDVARSKNLIEPVSPILQKDEKQDSRVSGKKERNIELKRERKSHKDVIKSKSEKDITKSIHPINQETTPINDDKKLGENPINKRRLKPLITDQHETRMRSKTFGAKSPVSAEPIFVWPKPVIRKISLPVENNIPQLTSPNVPKSSALFSKFSSNENLANNYTKTLIQNSPWSRNTLLQDGDGYRSLPLRRGQKPHPDIFPRIKEVPSLHDSNNGMVVVAGHETKEVTEVKKDTPVKKDLVKTSNQTGFKNTCQSLVDSGFTTLPKKKLGSKGKKISVKTISEELPTPSREDLTNEGQSNSLLENVEGEEQAEVKVLSIKDRIQLLKTQNEQKREPVSKVHFHYLPGEEIPPSDDL